MDADSPPPGDARVAIPDSDEALLAECRIDTFRSGGKGGQHQNVTESGVRLVHLPTGVTATSRSERSQHRNRAIALERLRRKLEKRNERRAPRLATSIPQREKRRRLEEKKRRAKRKELRKSPPPDDD